MYFPLTGTGTGYIDLAQNLSALNRKFFRQGMQYVVQKIEWLATNTSECFVYRLPHHWPLVNSHVKAQAMWLQQQNDRVEQSGLEQTIARYRDFKVYLDSDHVAATFANNLQAEQALVTPGLPGTMLTLPAAQVISPTVQEEWVASEIVWPNYGAPGTTVERGLHMLGDDNGVASVGVIKAYAESRNRPMQTDPNIVDVPLGGAFGSMFDVADDSGDIITNAQEHNDKLPYLNDIDSAEEFYPGGTNQGSVPTQQAMLTVSGTGDRVRGSIGMGFLCNCGLLAVGWAAGGSPGEDYGCLRITMAPGSYKGVMARPMKDVN